MTPDPFSRRLRWLRVVSQRVPRTLPFAKATFCPRLWHEAYVHDDGAVYACCHTLPFQWGNLHVARLEQIWNSGRARVARQLSRHRALYCFDRCTLLTASERRATATAEHRAVRPYHELTRIKILFGELCNIACIMCQQNHRSNRQLTLELLQRQIDWAHLEDIEFQGGEPLAMAECKRAYRWLTEELGKKVNFLTNGTLINDEWAARIVRGSKWVYFSINGVRDETFARVNRGAQLSRIKQNVARLLQARAGAGSNIEVVGHFTMVPENISEADQFPLLGAELGLDRVEYGFDVATVPQWLQRHPAETEAIRGRFRAVLQQPPLPIREDRLRYLGLVR